MFWILKVYANYANFRGRASRSEYWYFILFYIISIFVLSIIDGFIGIYKYGLLSGIFIIINIVPTICLTIRRIHDTGNSGWWWLISFVPLVGFFTILFFALKDSEEGTNEYGANPKEVLTLN